MIVSRRRHGQAAGKTPKNMFLNRVFNEMTYATKYAESSVLGNQIYTELIYFSTEKRRLQIKTQLRYNPFNYCRNKKPVNTLIAH